MEAIMYEAEEHGLQSSKFVTVQPRLSRPRLSKTLIIRTSWTPEIHYHVCTEGMANDCL